MSVENSLEERERRKVMNPKQVLEAAAGRTIIVGEHHIDRKGCEAVIALIEAADASRTGTRVLGVELSEEGYKYEDRHLRGLKEELDYLRSLKSMEEIPSYDDEFSYGNPDATGHAPTFNRLRQMKRALELGWKVVALDPKHWLGLSQSEKEDKEAAIREDMVKSIDDREREMVGEIKKYPGIIAIFGSAHLEGIKTGVGDNSTYDGIGDSAFFIDSLSPNFSNPADEENEASKDHLIVRREGFARNLPLLLKE